MRRFWVGMCLVAGLAGCGDPLSDVARLGEVDLSERDATAAALPSDAEVARDGFFGAPVATAPVAGVTDEVQQPAIAPRARTGLLGLSRRAVPGRRASVSDVFDTGPAGVPELDPAEERRRAALARVGSVDTTPKRSGLLRRRAPAAAAQGTGVDTAEVTYGEVVPFGVIARVCSAKGQDLGTRVEEAQARGFALHDSAVGAAGARTWYLTGFADGCPRQLTGANVLLGSASLYEQFQFGPGAANLKQGETDRAYARIKQQVCGTGRGKPCGNRIGRLDQSTFFVSAYERFGNSSRWTEVLVHDRVAVALAIKPN